MKKLCFDKEINKPIFIQLSEFIEDDIMLGIFKENTKIPSINELAMIYNINQATALKSVNQLINKGIVYKKRGIGMFVCKVACTTLQNRYKQQFLDMVRNMKKIGITNDEIINMLKNTGGNYSV